MSLTAGLLHSASLYVTERVERLPNTYCICAHTEDWEILMPFTLESASGDERSSARVSASRRCPRVIVISCAVRRAAVERSAPMSAAISRSATVVGVATTPCPGPLPGLSGTKILARARARCLSYSNAGVVPRQSAKLSMNDFSEATCRLPWSIGAHRIPHLRAKAQEIYSLQPSRRQGGHQSVSDSATVTKSTKLTSEGVWQ